MDFIQQLQQPRRELPAAARPGALSDGALIAPAKKPLRVFLVEDSKVVRDRLEEAMSADGAFALMGYADSEASAEWALQGSNLASYDVIILDLQLRQGNGLAVLRKIRSSDQATRPVVIIFTNFTTPHCRDMGVRCGADYFFDKSRDYDRLCQVLAQLAAVPR